MAKPSTTCADPQGLDRPERSVRASLRTDRGGRCQMRALPVGRSISHMRCAYAGQSARRLDDPPSPGFITRVADRRLAPVRPSGPSDVLHDAGVEEADAAWRRLAGPQHGTMVDITAEPGSAASVGRIRPARRQERPPLRVCSARQMAGSTSRTSRVVSAETAATRRASKHPPPTSACSIRGFNCFAATAAPTARPHGAGP